MRLHVLVVLCVALTTTCAEPDPKKFKSAVIRKDKDKTPTNTTLTLDEKKFLREVEAKYGIKSEKKEDKKDDSAESKDPKAGHLPFPAVIAIEIVNDTDAKTKGKRTIDANLGYGYKTQNGYTYSYFGKPAQEKGKFMIYPYSQEDIPPRNTHSFKHVDYSGKHVKTSVEITPSQAFELVAVKDEKPNYHYDKPSVEFKTPAPQTLSYSSSSGHNSQSYSSHPSTLYTTYNGEQFSGLSGQFPTVMPNYLVDPSQLLNNPEYQNVGLTQDHLRTHGSHLEQKVVPVLVLRIPSSSLTNPTAELYANLPQNYPLSNYINHLNLQELVNQYFKKAGYKFAPQVMAYSHGHENHGHSSHSYEPQHYAHPSVQPSYTQAHQSGVQYSAVQPVMARYPSSYARPHYVSMPKGYSLYKQFPRPQKYDYQYRYVPQSAVSSQKFFMPPLQYQQETKHEASQEIQDTQLSSLEQGAGVHDANTQFQYDVPAQVSASYESAVTPSTEYGTPQTLSQEQYENPHTSAPEYGSSKEQYQEPLYPGYESSGTPLPEYPAVKESAVSQVSNEYYSQVQHDLSHTAQSIQSNVGEDQHYVHRHQEQEPEGHGFVLSENYPSKDHTIATVLPSHYKSGKQNSGTIQSVSYVTPMPYSSKYQMPYKVMVPQTFLHNPSTEKVAYIHPHPLSAMYSQTIVHPDYNPEPEFTLGYQHVPPVGKQKPPPYPRNYHSHPKRMIRPENKQDSSLTTFSKNKNEKNEKKRSS